MDDPLIVPIPVERVCMRPGLATHADPRPAQLFDRDDRFLEVRVFGQHMRAEMQRKVLGHKNMVRDFGQIYCVSAHCGATTSGETHNT